MVVVEGPEHRALVEGQDGDAGDAEQDAREFHFAMEPSQFQSLHPVSQRQRYIYVSSVHKLKHVLPALIYDRSSCCFLLRVDTSFLGFYFAVIC